MSDSDTIVLETATDLLGFDPVTGPRRDQSPLHLTDLFWLISCNHWDHGITKGPVEIVENNTQDQNGENHPQQAD